MTTSAHRRKVLITALGAAGLVGFLVFASLNAWKLNFLNPATTAQIVVYTALSAVAFVLFIGVMLTLVRNVLKLFVDQRSRVMGSRLRTRMLVGAILVSLVPIVFMYSFSYGLLNRAMERWFSKPVTQIRDDSNQLALELSDYTVGNARVEAESIAASLPPLSAPANMPAIQRIMRQHEVTLQGGFVVVFSQGKAIADFNVPQHSGARIAVKPRLADQPAQLESDEESEQPVERAAAAPVETIDPADPGEASLLAAAERTDKAMFSLAGADYALGLAPVLNKSGSLGNVIVALPLPRGMSATIDRLHKETEDYWILYRARSTIRRFYLILLAMMTSLALFASTWLALYLSKQVTKPVEALADAMAAIAAGDYAHRVQQSATEELAELVQSFNHMAQDLEGTRSQVEAATSLLSQANAALEARSGELETMLETIPNGVATVTIDGRIVLTNRALTEMLDPGGRRPFIGRPMQEMFSPEMLEALDRLMQRSHRMGSASSELETPGPTGPLNLLITVALLETGNREHLGYVFVLENATELLRAQKQSAWKEVARRVAHEIKNPLTPISLSAEQIGRHIERLAATVGNHGLESPSIGIIRRCSEVISGSVESMRSLVDQFASLAQFPTAQPRPADLNTIVENSLALFAGRTQGIHLVRRLGAGLPLVLADPEAMKRALGNLVDNAVEAMAQSLLRELRISTALLPSGLLELTIADTGAGLTDDMRERLFLPYFSTKQRGTGLGLAIAAKIIQEHDGTIRAEKNEPAGAKFIVELRPASMLESESPTEVLTVSS